MKNLHERRHVNYSGIWLLLVLYRQLCFLMSLTTGIFIKVDFFFKEYLKVTAYRIIRKIKRKRRAN